MDDMKGSIDAWGSGLLGVIIFSGSLPATRVAVAGFSPLFLTSARAMIAALLGAALLVLLRQARPARRDLVSLTDRCARRRRRLPAADRAGSSAHHVGPFDRLHRPPAACDGASSAFCAAASDPSPLFWLFSCVGSATVVAFALSNGGSASLTGDLLMIASIILCGLGYAEGAKLSRRLGGWQVISWALVLAAPLMLLLTIMTLPSSWQGIGVPAWLGLAYVSIFSMLVGFVFWYRGLALGGIASVGQLQLLQPFFGLALAGLLLREPVAWTMIAATGLVVISVAFARRFA